MANNKERMSAIREMSNQEILDAIDEAKEEMFNLRFQRSSAQLENTSRVRIVRRDIARLKTALRQRQLAAELVQEDVNAK